MSDESKVAGHTKPQLGGRTLVAAGLFAAIGIGAGLYAIGERSGNVPQLASATQCQASAARAALLQDLNIGQVAAFQIADEQKFAGDLTFRDENGEMTGLGAHRGQTVLLNLWATWCAPCREEMPALDALQAALGSEDFTVLPVSVDLGDDSKPRSFYAETGLKTLPFRHDGTMATFNTLKKMGLAFGMPATVLVDADGCVLGSMNGPAHWNHDDARKLVGAVIGR